MRMSAVDGDESFRFAVGVSVPDSSGINRHVGRSRGRSRCSGKDQVLGHETSQVTSNVGRNVYEGTPQILRSLN